MKKLAAVAFAALATASAALVYAGSASAHAGGDDLSFLAKEAEVTDLDLGESGPSQGDQMLWRDDLYDGHDELVGSDGGACIVTRAGDEAGSVLCTVGFDLPDRGKITVSGLVTSEEFGSGRFEVPVTGGSGEFEGATGHLAVEFVDDTGRDANLSFHLR